ncbi:BBP7 family outer membrane beta-barrel protein [Anatilimnocola sp. NA78]|uniref:BBP7 family outer membrane beta-barrel protein n=1 Tax=Anatilimnocola sp. NA78 TaxID=3415683 RepID=UPI003CE53A46
MPIAWDVRRFLLPLAGVVCWTSLGVAAELLTPPQPPPDNDGLELNHSNSFGPQPVLVEAVSQPANLLPPPDPQPVIEQPQYEYSQYPSPPIVYGPACETVMAPSCDTPLYSGFHPPMFEAAPTCDAAAGGACYCSCVPTWTFRAEALLWNRSGGADVPLVTAPVAISSGDLDTGWAAGPRLTAIRHGIFGSCWDAEVSYFGIDGWNGTANLADIDNFQTTPVTNIVGVAPGTIAYTSSLHSAEFNLRRAHSDWVTWLVGFRAVQVGERLNLNAGGATISTDTINHLYGAQLGLDLRFLDCGTWYVNGLGKAGIYGNTADQVTRTAGVGGALPFVTSGGNQTSFVGEVGLNAGYRLTDRFSLLAGYSVVWVDGVALAPDQLAGTNVTTGVSAINANGSLVYHGFNFGLEYGW